MKRISKSALIIIISAISVPLYLSSQQYNFKNYTVASGLGSSTVNHIFQDSKGYIWFATQGGGASRFNGKEFTNFTKADGLINNDVTYVTEDQKGNIWFATASGASQFNGKEFTNYSKKQGLTDDVVYCIYADTTGEIWFATKDAGVKVLSPLSFGESPSRTRFGRVGVRSLSFSSCLLSNQLLSFYTIAKDKTGKLWFGLSEGIASCSNGKLTCYDSEKTKGKSFFSSTCDSKGNVWFGSTAGDVVIIHADNSLEKLALPSVCAKDFIGGIAQDKNGNMWLATEHGLLKYNGAGLLKSLSFGEGFRERFKLFGEREGLSVNSVQAVMCDYEENIWAGTLSGGVNLLSSEAFVHYTDKDGLSSENVTCICPAPSGKNYLIGTGNGLFVFHPNTSRFKKIPSIRGIEKANITSLSVAPDGLLWLSTQEGVFVLETKEETFSLRKKYTTIDKQTLISPNKIIHDSKGNCWLATFGSGAFLINGKTEKHFNKENGFPSDNVLTVFEDSKTNLWFGTLDAGVIKYDGLNFSPPVSGGVPATSGRGGNKQTEDKSAWCITEDNRGNIYWGTGQSGICAYYNGETKFISIKDGLSSDYITSLQWDVSNNCLWAASEKGLDKVQFDVNQRVKKIQSYKEQEGSGSAGINQNGIRCNAEGSLWLAAVNGLWRFNPQLDTAKNIPPRIQLTGIRLFYQKADWKKFSDSVNYQTNLPENLQLPYNKNHLTFDIQALTTGEAFYTFKLEGQDNEWSAPERNNAVTYSNISPGEYIFKAKAISSTGIQSEEAIVFSFAIHPPWWNTWWFYVLAATAAITTLISFIKAREKLLREQNIKLEATVQQRTQVIEQQKQTVEKMLSEKEVLLKEIHHRVKNNLQTISSMLMLQSMELTDEEAKKAITESQSRVRSIALVHQKLYQTDGLEKVELSGFVKDLTEQIRSLYHLPSKNISVLIRIPETYILIDKAIPLGLIVNELFTNSLKYAFKETDSGEIKIEAETIESESKSKKLKLTYRDNGRGFNYNELSESSDTLGIELIKLLSEQIGAVLNYSNASGSEFVFIFGINI